MQENLPGNAGRVFCRVARNLCRFRAPLLEALGKQSLCLLQFAPAAGSQILSAAIDEVIKHPHAGGWALGRNFLRRQTPSDGRGVFGKQPFRRMRRVCGDAGDPLLARLGAFGLRRILFLHNDSDAKKKRKARRPSLGLRLLNYKNGNADARMQHVKQEVLTIDVIDVAVIVVGPVSGPRIDQLERVAPVDHHRL
jgi:hypothetical protein